MELPESSGELILTDAILANVGTAIRQLRRSRSLTMSQLAVKAGIDQGNLSRIENGKTKPTLDTITRIALAFDILPFVFINALMRWSDVEHAERIEDEVSESRVSNQRAFEYIHPFTDTNGAIDPRYGDYVYLRVLRDLPVPKWLKDDVLLVSPHDRPRTKDILIFDQDSVLIAARVTFWKSKPKWKGSSFLPNSEVLAPYTAAQLIRDDAEPVGIVVEVRRTLRTHHDEPE